MDGQTFTAMGVGISGSFILLAYVHSKFVHKDRFEADIYDLRKRMETAVEKLDRILGRLK